MISRWIARHATLIVFAAQIDDYPALRPCIRPLELAERILEVGIPWQTYTATIFFGANFA